MGLPKDVIVIGVGGMGSSACFHLARRGCRVLGLEQFSIGHDQGSSHGETRLIRRAYFEHPAYVPLLNRAYELWRELEQESAEELFVQNGLVIYGDPKTSAIYKGTLQSARQNSIPLEELTRAQALTRFPFYQPWESLDALYEPGAGFVHVERTVLAHAKLAREHGAEIHDRESVRGYKIDADGATVETDRGSYRAAKLVIAGGAWSSKLLENVPLELKRVVQYWFRASKDYALERGTPCFAFHGEKEFFYGFPMLDGRTVKIAAHYSRDAITDPSEKEIASPPAAQLAALREFIGQALPGVTSELDRWKTCLYTMTPDENFVIDQHPRHANVVFAAGFSGHGFKFSPVIGEILADLSLAGTTSQPIDFLKSKRFSA